jgi:hypothetical protein
MDEISRTYIDGGGFGGLGTGGTLGVGALGGLILGSMWNGNGFFGWGNNGRNGVVGYDTGVLNGLQDSVNNISTQINAADRDFLMQTANQNQFVGNLVNQTGDAIVGAVNSGVQTLGAAVNSGNQAIQGSICNLGQAVQNGIFQNTLSQVQGQAATNLGMCQGFNGVGAGIAGATAVVQGSLADINNNITAQNFENRLQAQQLSAQQQQNCCQVLRAIEQEGCANRELQREIQTQNIRDQLAVSQAENQSLKAQLFSTNAMAAQTATIINALKPATTTGG